jgi:hypothetical protein
MLVVGAVVVQFKILSNIMVTTLCAVSGFQSTVVVSLCGYATYIQPLGTAAATTTIFNPVISSSHIYPYNQ